MNWLHYLAEANIYLGVFYLAYCVFLTKETHYQLNRGYLLFSCIMSFALPILQVGALKPAEPVAVSTSYIVPQDHIPSKIAAPITITPIVVEEHHLTTDDYLWYTYIIGAGILLIVLAIKFYTLFKLMRNAQRIKHDKYKLVYLPETDVAFSFFNYLFIGNNAPGANTIITHELVHIRQRHSVDIIFLEVLKVVSWFNPFIYLLQNSLKTVHEYIADEQTATYESDALAYSSFLVNNAYGAGGSSITHSFFNYNLLKKRIIMLNQQRSGRVARLKYLVALPLCAGLLCVSTLAFSKTYGWVDIDPAKVVKADVTKAKPSPQKHAQPATLSVKGKLIIVDGKIVHPKPEETISADSMVDIPANTPSAIKKWGDKAKNGVRLFIGHTMVIKKSNSPLTHTVKEDDPAGPVTPSGYKQGYEKLTHSFTESPIFESGLSYYQQLRKTNATIKDAIVVVGFNVGDDKKLSNVKVVKGSGSVMDNAISGAFGSFTGNVTDKPGFHTYLVHISTHGHTEDEDSVVCKKNGYDNHYTIAVGSYLPVKDNAPNSIAARNPDAILRSDLDKFYKNLTNTIKYPADEMEKGKSGIVNALFSIDADHKIQYVQIIMSPSESLSNEVINALKGNTSLNIFKPGSQYVVPVFFKAGNTSPQLAITGKVVTYNPASVDIPSNQTIWTMDVVSINDNAK